ncbi:MAG: SRPBCC family protein [Enhydrobacter sp.]
MAEAFYSIVLDHTAADVWSVIRPFGHYAWAGVPGETTIEEGKAADRVGAVRRVELPGRTIRQVLLAHSDLERSYSYAFVGPPPQKVRDYVATIRVTPVIESGQAFVEWCAA